VNLRFKRTIGKAYEDEKVSLRYKRTTGEALDESVLRTFMTKLLRRRMFSFTYLKLYSTQISILLYTGPPF